NSGNPHPAWSARDAQPFWRGFSDFSAVTFRPMPRAYSPSVRRRRLSAQLRRLREAAGLTLTEAAESAGIPRAKLGRIETHETPDRDRSGVRTPELPLGRYR